MMWRREYFLRLNYIIIFLSFFNDIFKGHLKNDCVVY